VKCGIALAIALIAGAAHEGIAQMSQAADRELETQLLLLQDPHGDPQHQRQRAQAAQWLLAHAERAYPRLLQLARAGNLSAIDLVPAFARPESVAVLAALLGEPERTAWTAAQALARQPGTAAIEALCTGLRVTSPVSIAAAADGLAARRDPQACAALRAAVSVPDAGARYRVIRAAAELGCLVPSELQKLASDDPSDDIRALASKLLGPRVP
jgi:hypothetical protein